MGQKLASVEIPKRVVIKLNKNIKSSGVNGVMNFGLDNDYPQIIEKLINGSVTAKAASKTLARFLAGDGFVDERINKVVVGIDTRGKDITMRSLTRQIATDLSKNNGAYIHRNINIEGITKDVHLKPFKDGRFAKPDDRGYFAKIAFYDNWEKDTDKGRYKKEDINYFSIFSNSKKAIAGQIKGEKGSDFEEKIKKYKGQVYFISLDDEYFYPLSPFDASYLDLDTEAQVGLFKNRLIRNGMSNKIILRVSPDGTEEEQEEFVKTIKSTLGVDGEQTLILQDTVDEDGNIKENGAFAIDEIKGNINDKLFENWEVRLSNNIRKSAGNLPARLIDYEESKLSAPSADAIKIDVSFYNALTKDGREIISESLKDIFKNTDDEVLKSVTNWDLKPFVLIKDEEEKTVE